MKLGNEALLVLLALALYVFDACLMLARDEALIVRGRSQRWFAAFGAHGWRLAGREPCLPNLLTPHRPMFRLRWSFEGEPPAAPAARPVSAPPVLDAIAPFTGVSALCLFVLLPLALFVPMLGIVFTLIVVLLLYVNIGWALTLVHRDRATFGLTPRAFAALAFECIVCPPFSVNLLRKLCARLAPDETLTHAAARLMDPADRAACLAACRVRLDEAIDAEAEGSPRMQALIASRTRFPAAD